MSSKAEQIGRPSLEQLPDHAIVSRILAGEPELFELIMRRYNRRLFRIARGIVPNTAEAEDVVQDSYIRAYFKLGQFRGPDGFPSWLYRIVTNEALMRRRSAAPLTEALSTVEESSSQEAAMIDRPSPAANPEAALHETQLRRLLETAIDALPEDFRAVFVLREVERLSVVETADCLGLEPGTVKTRVYRARRLLQRNVTAELRAALTGAFPFDGDRCDRLVTSVLRRLELP